MNNSVVPNGVIWRALLDDDGEEKKFLMTSTQFCWMEIFSVLVWASEHPYGRHKMISQDLITNAQRGKCDTSHPLNKCNLLSSDRKKEDFLSLCKKIFSIRLIFSLIYVSHVQLLCALRCVLLHSSIESRNCDHSLTDLCWFPLRHKQYLSLSSMTTPF